jgi:hypothetical protein
MSRPVAAVGDAENDAGDTEEEEGIAKARAEKTNRQDQPESSAEDAEPQEPVEGDDFNQWLSQ